MYFANVVLHFQNAPCSDRVKQFLAAAAAIHIREGFVLLLLHHQQMERKLHSQNNLSYIMALESQRRVRKGAHSECSGGVHYVSAKCCAAERHQLSRGPSSECLQDTCCCCWSFSFAHHCAPSAEGVAAGLSPLENSVGLSAPANPSGGASGAEKRSIPLLPGLKQKWVEQNRLLSFPLYADSEIAVLLYKLSGREL